MGHARGRSAPVGRCLWAARHPRQATKAAGRPSVATRRRPPAPQLGPTTGTGWPAADPLLTRPRNTPGGTTLWAGERGDRTLLDRVTSADRASRDQAAPRTGRS